MYKLQDQMKTRERHFKCRVAIRKFKRRVATGPVVTVGAAELWWTEQMWLLRLVELHLYQ